MCGFVGMHRYYTKRCRDESYLMAGRADKKMSIRTASGEENARRSVTSISDSKMAGTQLTEERRHRINTSSSSSSILSFICIT
jgi:hypothetical protein